MDRLLVGSGLLFFLLCLLNVFARAGPISDSAALTAYPSPPSDEILAFGDFLLSADRDVPLSLRAQRYAILLAIHTYVVPSTLHDHHQRFLVRKAPDTRLQLRSLPSEPLEAFLCTPHAEEQREWERRFDLPWIVLSAIAQVELLSRSGYSIEKLFELQKETDITALAPPVPIAFASAMLDDMQHEKLKRMGHLLPHFNFFVYLRKDELIKTLFPYASEHLVPSREARQ